MFKVLISTDSRYPVNRNVIRRAIADVLTTNKIITPVEVSVSVVGGRKMRELSEKYLGDKEMHEVLSFPLEDVATRGGFVNLPDDVLRLGDIVLCWPQILELASQEDKLVDDEVYFLTNHATLHLLGKHHD